MGQTTTRRAQFAAPRLLGHRGLLGHLDASMASRCCTACTAPVVPVAPPPENTTPDRWVPQDYGCEGKLFAFSWIVESYPARLVRGVQPMIIQDDVQVIGTVVDQVQAFVQTRPGDQEGEDHLG
jgi:hypothetical protein